MHLFELLKKLAEILKFFPNFVLEVQHIYIFVQENLSNSYLVSGTIFS